MTLGRAHMVELVGTDGVVVEVEADLGVGLPGTHLVGMADVALREARDRVRAAVRNTGIEWPRRKLVLSLSPASLPKSGSRFDLALAVAVLVADGKVPQAAVEGTLLVGELALDGRLRAVTGVLPAVAEAARAGFARVVVPAECLAEAALVDDIDARGATDLTAVVQHLRGVAELPAGEVADRPKETSPGPDLADVVGQDEARWALEVAAAGGHHLRMIGPPGSGKTMLARRLPGLLPTLGRAEAIEVTAVHSVAGLIRPDRPLIDRPVFEDPHHTCTQAALIGGGAGLARPGAVSRAHHGVLFLDEVGECMPHRGFDVVSLPSGSLRLSAPCGPLGQSC